MSKRHQYRITVEHTRNPDGSVPQESALEFDFASHDDLFRIIENLKVREDIGPDMAAPLALGIKLFGGTMMENRGRELFSGLFPHFSEFMKKLKGKKPR